MAQLYRPKRRASLPGAIGLIALMGLLIHPANAQTLNLQSGDNVVVSNSGTSGIYQGQFINTTTSAYNGVTVNPSSVFAISGGSISAGGAGGTGLYNNGGSVFVNGGTLSGSPYTYGEGFFDVGGTAFITGGSFSGGTVNGIGLGVESSGGNPVYVDGGVFTGGEAGLAATFGGVIDLFGTFNQTAPITSGSGSIIGTLADGETINTTYYAGGTNGVGTGTIEFNVAPAPEPSSTTALSIGLAFLGVFVTVKKRRRSSAQP